MPKPDAAHLQTDKELAKLEKRIAKIYKEAADDLQSTIDDYFAKFVKRDAKQKARLEAGKITEQEYKQWRLAQMGRGERFKALQSRVAERYTEANETAVRYVNDATPGIYSLNRNYSAYTIEKVAGNVGFDLWDEQTVKRLIVENPEVMPYYPPEKALKRGIDLAYGKKQISASVTSSILQGKSIPGIAKDLQTRIPDMNKASAIRTARTAVTGAQNAGRMDSYVAAEKMGIKVRKEWLATLDGRTRHSHAMLDGQNADIDKPFKVDGEEIMFPGDTSAPGYLVYNCFVGETQIASDSKIVRSYKHTYNGDLIEVKTACGINFTCTPNHPILTPYGWVAAALLHNGDNLVVTFDRNTGSFRRNSNIKHIHSSMKALYNSLQCFGLMSRDSTLRINFHGDIPTTNVEVITKKWLLRNNGNSGVRQSINKFLLKNANKPLMSQCPLMKHFGSVCKAAFRFISGKCQTLALLWRSLLHPNVHRFRTVSGRDIGVTQDTVNNLTAKSETLGKVLDGFSGEIAVDKVVSVKIIPSGQTATHVYNLQTENGYYFVNSSIAQSKSKCNGIFAIAKNCRCTMVAAVDGVDTSNAQRRVRNPETGKNELVSDMTYQEWAGWKKKTEFTPAKTTAEAEAYAKEHIFSGAYLGKTSYKGVDVDMANGINETLERITQKYGRKLSGIEVVNPKTAKGLKALGGSADAPFATNSLNGMVYINKDIVKNANALKAYTDKGDEAFKLVMANKGKLSGKMRALAEIYEKAGKDLVDSSLEGMITHEYGHYLAVAINPKSDVVSKIADGMGEHLVSGYSQHNVREYLAECFTEYERGDRSKLDPIVIELFEGAIKR